MNLDSAELARTTGGEVIVEHGTTTIDVPPDRWVEAARALRDGLGFSMLDVLTVVDQLPAGLEVVVRLWSVADRAGVLLRTAVPREQPELTSLSSLWAGAGWHERHASEMFGVCFTESPDRSPLLLTPAGAASTPLRKERPLERRADRPWPGSQDPAHSGPGGRPARRLLQPPGAR